MIKESKDGGENEVHDIEETLEKVFQNTVVEKDQRYENDSYRA